MPLPTLPSTSAATPATAPAAGRPASQRATAQSAPHAAPREGRSTAAQARAPLLTTSSGPAPAPPPVTTRPALAVDRAPPPPRTTSAAPTPFPDRNRAPLHTARSWTAWFHGDLTTWPPPHSNGGDGSTQTFSWLYCALLAEAAFGIRFPYTQTNEFGNQIIERDPDLFPPEHATPIDMRTLWPQWVGTYREVLTSDFTMGNVLSNMDAPHLLHWTTHFQEQVRDRVDLQRPHTTSEMNVLIHAAGYAAVNAQRRRRGGE